MALNCCMLTPRQPPTPVPLPEEKAFISIPGVQIKLQAMASSSQVRAGSIVHSSPSGSIYLTSKRVIFVAPNAASLPLPSPQPEPGSNQHRDRDRDLAEIRSLSVNLANLRSGRFVQPWLSANYYDAVLLPQPGGGLGGLYTLKIYFNEGRAFEFHQTLEDVRARYREQQPVAEEPLPLYDSASSSAGSAASQSTSHPATASGVQQPLPPPSLQLEGRPRAPPTTTPSNATSTPDELPPAYDSAA